MLRVQVFSFYQFAVEREALTGYRAGIADLNPISYEKHLRPNSKATGTTYGHKNQRDQKLGRRRVGYRN